jgi:3-oxoacyl-[acyl-carrier protein] reductase
MSKASEGTAVTVNAIVAGSTKTEGVAKFIQDLFPGLSLEEAEKRFMGESGNRSSSLIQRLIDPKEIADFVIYVSSPLASATNGAALRIDGGLVRSVF